MKRNRLKIIIAAGAFFGVVLLGLGLRACRLPSPTELYRTQGIVEGELAMSVSATGALNPVTVVAVGTQVSGTVKELKVDYNDRVEENQVLLTLDEEMFRARVHQGRANLAGAMAKLKHSETQYNRIERLVLAKAKSQDDLDVSGADLAMAQAAVDQARAQLVVDEYNLANAVIRSPVSGVVIDRLVDLGQTVAASFQTPTLIKIAKDLTKMQINANFAEADIGGLKADMVATFKVDAFPKREYQGRVRQVRLNSTVQQNVVTYDVVIDVDNLEETLLPGMTAYVDVVVSRVEKALLVPNAALRFRPPQPDGNKKSGGQAGPPLQGAKGPSLDKAGKAGQVYLIQGGLLKAVDVRLGLSDGRQTEVLGGDLKAGDEVVVGNQSVGQSPPRPLFRRM